MAAFVLVHSPLVGPATWRQVADELRRRGFEALVPARRAPLDTGRPYWAAAAGDVVADLHRSGDDEVVLVGHSGAGPWLPAIGEAVAAAGRRLTAVLFVDAGLPTAGPVSATLTGPFLAQLEALTGPGGVLPPWPEWWPPETLATLVPDPVARAALVAECRPVPADLWDDPAPSPPGWPGSVPCGYLSFTYEDDASAAQERGWIVARMDGHHLQAIVDPAGVADALQLLLGALGVLP